MSHMRRINDQSARKRLVRSSFWASRSVECSGDWMVKRRIIIHGSWIGLSRCSRRMDVDIEIDKRRLQWGLFVMLARPIVCPSCVFACFETICYRNVANMCCKIGLAICRNLYIRYLRNKGGRWLTSSSCTALLSHVITWFIAIWWHWSFKMKFCWEPQAIQHHRPSISVAICSLTLITADFCWQLLLSCRQMISQLDS